MNSRQVINLRSFQLCIKVVLLAFCYSAWAGPDWYLDYRSKGADYLLLGYGEGATLDEAKTAAMRDVATQLSASISSETNMAVRQRNEEKARSRFDQQSAISTSINLAGVELLKAEQWDEDERWYVAMRYDNRPASTKLAERLNPNQSCKTDSKQNPLLTNFDPVRELNSQLGCQPEIKLRYINGSWNMAVDAIYQPLLPHEFARFLQPLTSESVVVDSKKSTVYEGEPLTLSFRANGNGYLSCIVVYHSGKVAVLFDNMKVSAGDDLLFPSPDSGLELVSELEVRGEATQDLYFAVLSKESRNLSRFEDMGESIVNSDSSYLYGELLEAVSQEKVSSLLVTTLPTGARVGR